jgi:uncharacterized protein (TIGR01777 family)
MQSRIQATEAVMDALRRVSNKPRVLVQGSAINYYGTHEGETITEMSPPGNDFLAAVVKEWEAASAPAEALGVRLVLIRSASVLAREDSVLTFLALPTKLFVGGPLGSGRHYLPWIHLEDEVAAIRFLLSREDTSGPYNLTAPNTVTQKEFSQVLG